MIKWQYKTEGVAGQFKCHKEERVPFGYANVSLGRINQGDEITAHPHSEHRVQIQSLNSGKDAANLDRVQNKAGSAESLTAQEGWKNAARNVLNHRRTGGRWTQPCMYLNI